MQFLFSYICSKTKKPTTAYNTQMVIFVRINLYEFVYHFCKIEPFSFIFTMEKTTIYLHIIITAKNLEYYI